MTCDRRRLILDTRRSALLAVLFGACSTLLSLPAAAGYIQQNLVSDLPGVAAVQDLNLVNPWGCCTQRRSPIWVSDNGTGLTTLYNGSGTPQSLVVTIAPPASPPPDFNNSSPTGQVFNIFNTTSPNDFVLPNGKPGRVLFLRPKTARFRPGTPVQHQFSKWIIRLPARSIRDWRSEITDRAISCTRPTSIVGISTYLIRISCQQRLAVALLTRIFPPASLHSMCKTSMANCT